jgi:hypothetical protein
MKLTIKDLEIKKLIQEYSFLLTDDEYKKQLITEFQTAFLNAIQKVREELGLPTPPPVVDNGDKKDDNQKKKKVDPDMVDKETKDKIKKIYREIVKLTHPDKVETQEAIDLYMKATEAADNFDLFELYQICDQLNIVVDLDLNDKSLLNILIDTKKDELKNLENSFVWKWIHLPSEDDKKNLIKVFINNYG